MKEKFFASLISVVLALPGGLSAAGPDAALGKVSSLGRGLQEVLSASEINDQLARLGQLFDASGASAGGDAGAMDADTAAAANQRKARMLESLDFIRNAFKAGYAPAAWKARHAGWDLDREIEKAKEEIRAAHQPSVKDFQGVLRRVINSTQDYHVSVQFAATESARLPFTVVGVQGRYYIAWVDREKLPEGSFPFQVGDEITEFGGRSTAEVVSDLKLAVGHNTQETDLAIAALYLTSRRASNGLDVPKEPVAIAVKRRGAQGSVTHQLAWNYTPETIRFDPKSAGGDSEGKPRFMVRSNDMLSPLFGKEPGANPYRLGTRKSYLPDFGEKIWESGTGPEEPFHAYIYRASDGRVIGYVRIPSYVPDDVGKAVAHFGKLVAKFEGVTDALVIDQVNNPGGGVFYLYTLASMLTDQALKTPKHRVALTQADVEQAAELLALEKDIKNDEDARKVLGPDLNGYPVTYQLARYMIEYGRFLITEWNAGRTLSQATYLYGVDQINPSTVARYTKPVLLLVNELDFSGGDFFPAILQDNKRVTVFGTRTAGAGGFVNGFSFPNWLGVTGLSLTGSLAERVDGNPIENLGVKPDVDYALTENDIQNGFKGYLKAVEGTLGRMIQAKGAAGRR